MPKKPENSYEKNLLVNTSRFISTLFAHVKVNLKNANVPLFVMEARTCRISVDIPPSQRTEYFNCRNIAEQLIEKGLASVVRHKRDDEDRSSDYDKLMAAEQALVLISFFLRSPILKSFGTWLEQSQIREGFIPAKKTRLPNNPSISQKSVQVLSKLKYTTKISNRQVPVPLNF